MNWVNSRKCPWTCVAGIAFAIMILLSMSSCDVSAPTDALIPTKAPVLVTIVASAPVATPTLTSTPTATDTPIQSYPAIALVSPAAEADIVGEKLIEFSWEWGGTLQEGEQFDLRIWRLGKPSSTIAILCEPSFLIDTPPDGFGRYGWQVAVVRIDKNGSKSTLSESLMRSFVWSDATPTPTSTAMLPPTPKPDAVVNVEALNLRFGPGTVYDVIGWLKQGDPLKVTGRNPAGNWLKVATTGGKEGWTAHSPLQVNVDISSVPVVQAPPTPTPTCTPTPTRTLTPALLSPPTLVAPENSASFIGPVLLKWQWDRPLEQDEYFSVRVWREGEPEPCFYAQVQGPVYFGTLGYCADGKHYWQVVVVRRISEGPPLVEWVELSEVSEARWFNFSR